jgi:hypothetical protein
MAVAMSEIPELPDIERVDRLSYQQTVLAKLARANWSNREIEDHFGWRPGVAGVFLTRLRDKCARHNIALDIPEGIERRYHRKRARHHA